MNSDNKIFEIYLKRIQTLTDTVEKASERSRSILYILTIGSLLLIIAGFNMKLSWDNVINPNNRILLLSEIKAIPNEMTGNAITRLNKLYGKKFNDSTINSEIIENVNQFLNEKRFSKDSASNDSINKLFISYLDSSGILYDRREFLRNYMKRRSFGIPILGIEASANDLYLLGSFGLAILLAYAFFMIRRESQVVYKIYTVMRDLKIIGVNNTFKLSLENSSQKKIKYYLLDTMYQGCVQSFILINTNNYDIYIRNDKMFNYKDDFFLSIQNKTQLNYIRIKNIFTRFFIFLINFLPLISLVFIMGIELIDTSENWIYFQPNDKQNLKIRYLFFGIMFILIAIQQIAITLVQKNTKQLFIQMKKIRDNARVKPKFKPCSQYKKT